MLDDFGQAPSAGPFVADLLASSPGVRVLATSGQRLRLSGEQVYPVPPLPVPDLAGSPARPDRCAAGWTACRWPSNWSRPTATW